TSALSSVLYAPSFPLPYDAAAALLLLFCAIATLAAIAITAVTIQPSLCIDSAPAVTLSRGGREGAEPVLCSSRALREIRCRVSPRRPRPIIGHGIMVPSHGRTRPARSSAAQPSPLGPGSL